MEPQELPPNDRPLLLRVNGCAKILVVGGIVALCCVGAALDWKTTCFVVVVLVVVAGVIVSVKDAYRAPFAALVVGLLVIVLCFPTVKKGWGPSLRPYCARQLRQIGFALECYKERHGRYPPAYIADANGRPMHSWRVLLLRELDCEVIYRAYRFDEPWDGPNNRKLHNIEIPWVFHCPADPSPKTMTSYVAITGPETAWPGTRGRPFSEIKDGLTFTATVAEMSESGIHWMEPRDLPMIGMPPRMNDPCNSSIRSKHVDGANVLFGDGRCHFLNNDVPWRTLRALLTVDAGEQLSKNDLDGSR